MWKYLTKWASPRNFYQWSGQLLPVLTVASIVLMIYGFFLGLFIVPADYQQGDAFRIIYVHVPAAFCSLMVYGVITVCAFVSLVWRIKLADVILQSSVALGACFTFLALVSGSLWGKPMWGTWWIWDARLTSELILFFIYLGLMSLRQAISHRDTAIRAVAIFALVGALDLPVIHYSVNWWNSLHQGSTLRVFSPSLIDSEMLRPLIVLIFAFILFYAVNVLARARTELLWRERQTAWAREVIEVSSV